MLRALTPEYRSRFEEMVAEYAANHEAGPYTGFYDTAWQGFDAYSDTLTRLAAGGWPLPEVVLGATFLVVKNSGLARLGEPPIKNAPRHRCKARPQFTGWLERQMNTATGLVQPRSTERE